MLHAGSGQFDGERQSIQVRTDGGHSRGIGVGHREIRLHGLRALNKESYCLVVRESLDIRQVFEGGYRQRRHNEFMLGSYMQPHTAGHYYLQQGQTASRSANITAAATTCSKLSSSSSSRFPLRAASSNENRERSLDSLIPSVWIMAEGT